MPDAPSNESVTPIPELASSEAISPPRVLPPEAEGELPVRAVPGQLSLGTFRALRHRNYRLYFIGQFFSLTGTWMQTPALLWLAYQLTGQSRWPAWITAAHFLPTCLFGYWGGALADRFPKRALLFVTQTLLLLLPLVLVGLVLAEVASPWTYLTVAAVSGVVLAVDFPTRLAFVFDMVGKEDLTNAVALNSLLFNTARLLGPLLGGLVLAAGGPTWCFWCNSLTYLAVLFALLRMDTAAWHSRPAASVKPAPPLGGFAYLATRPNLLAMLLLAGLVCSCGWPFLSLLPALAAKVLDAPQFGYTLLLSGTGLGALTAALTVATASRADRSRQFIVGGIVLVVLGLLGLSLAGWLTLAVACSVLIGFGMIVFFSTGQALMQLGAGDYNRGQVMGIWAMVISGAQPLGNLLAGPAADQWGEQWVLAGLAAILGSGALLIGAVVANWKTGARNHESHESHE
jgi:MFS family permease